ncbi:GNAT family N-acetyltransferase [Elizabethkingia ursingii]|uniref:GNAT family N-acetyltransferase n=1 Tax=Elizabethkingia ursingii TaxID=1756150 RepID=UPI00201196AF|nr:GNAT family N-acetyltransferase [Elizabethkingia ursingii]MCL1672009.1 N-acetyltransferase [Elizabethkingia ursingii]
MEIKHKREGSKGVFEAIEYDRVVGLMTYSVAGEDKIIIDHTEVDEAFGGKGIGKQLVNAGVDYARENNIKIIPLCPYANRVLHSSDEYKDILA